MVCRLPLLDGLVLDYVDVLWKADLTLLVWGVKFFSVKKNEEPSTLVTF